MDNIIKFPRSPCRQVPRSRKPRRSKSGTPKARVTPQISELDREYLDRHFYNFHNRPVVDPPFVGFLRQLGGYVVQEFATGKEVDQIFDELIAQALQTGRRP
jgi:hypothetical protein